MGFEIIKHGHNTKGINEFYDYQFNLGINDEEKINELANELKKYYTRAEELARSLSDDIPFNTELIKYIINSRIPNWADGVPSKLQVVRSEFGEVIAQIALKQLFRTHIPLSRLQHKEKALLPTRGIDLLGVEFEGESPILILGEVKVSEQDSVPPSVVKSSKKDCLEKRIPYLLTTKVEIVDELSYFFEHCSNMEDKKMFLQMINKYLETPNEVLVVGAPFLIRSLSEYSSKDVGDLLNFKCDGKLCKPCTACNSKRVRFIRLRVDNVNELSKKVYNVARGGI